MEADLSASFIASVPTSEKEIIIKKVMAQILESIEKIRQLSSRYEPSGQQALAHDPPGGQSDPAAAELHNTLQNHIFMKQAPVKPSETLQWMVFKKRDYQRLVSEITTNVNSLFDITSRELDFVNPSLQSEYEEVINSISDETQLRQLEAASQGVDDDLGGKARKRVRHLQLRGHTYGKVKTKSKNAHFGDKICNESNPSFFLSNSYKEIEIEAENELLHVGNNYGA